MIRKRGINFVGKPKSVKLEKVELRWTTVPTNEPCVVREELRVSSTLPPTALRIPSSLIMVSLDETADKFYPTRWKLKLEDAYDMKRRNSFDYSK